MQAYKGRESIQDYKQKKGKEKKMKEKRKAKKKKAERLSLPSFTRYDSGSEITVRVITLTFGLRTRKERGEKRRKWRQEKKKHPARS